jgi:hypothetical protein
MHSKIINMVRANFPNTTMNAYTTNRIADQKSTQTALSPEELAAHANPQFISDADKAKIFDTSYESNGAQGHFIRTNAELNSPDGGKQSVELTWPFKAFKAPGDKTLQLRIRQEKPRPMTRAEALAQETSSNQRRSIAKTDKQRLQQERTNDTLAKMAEDRRKWSSVRNVDATELPDALRTVLLKQLALKNPTHTSDKLSKGDRISPLAAVSPELKELKRVLEIA